MARGHAVVRFRPEARPRLETVTDRYRLDRLDRHDCLGEPSVELAIPLNVAAEAGHHAVCDDFKDAANGVVAVFRQIDRGPKPLFARLVGDSYRRRLDPLDDRGIREVTAPRLGRADLEHLGPDGDAELAEKPLRHATESDARGRFSGTRALQNRADVVATVLVDARQVSVTWSRHGHPR